MTKIKNNTNENIYFVPKVEIAKKFIYATTQQHNNNPALNTCMLNPHHGKYSRTPATTTGSKITANTNTHPPHKQKNAFIYQNKNHFQRKLHANTGFHLL